MSFNIIPSKPSSPNQEKPSPTLNQRKPLSPAVQPPEITILVVDDCPEVVDWVTDSLKAPERVLFRASNGKEALEKIFKHQPQIVILDVLMPGEFLLEEILNIGSIAQKGSHLFLDHDIFVRQNQHRVPLLEIIKEKDCLIQKLQVETEASFIEPLPDYKNYRFDRLQSGQTLQNIIASDEFKTEFGNVFITLNGYEVCRMVKTHADFPNQETNEPPYILLFSGGDHRSIEESQKYAQEVGASVYIHKSQPIILLDYVVQVINKIQQSSP